MSFKSTCFTTSIVLATGLASAARAGEFTLTADRDIADAVVLDYSPATGNLFMHANGLGSDGSPLLVTTWDLKSANGWFLLDNLDPNFIIPPCDTCGLPYKLFKLGIPPNALSELPHGDVLPPGLDIDDLLAELDVNGSITPRGDLTSAPGGGPYLYVVPEPHALTLIVLGFVVCLGFFRGQ